MESISFDIFRHLSSKLTDPVLIHARQHSNLNSSARNLYGQHNTGSKYLCKIGGFSGVNRNHTFIINLLIETSRSSKTIPIFHNITNTATGFHGSSETILIYNKSIFLRVGLFRAVSDPISHMIDWFIKRGESYPPQFGAAGTS